MSTTESPPELPWVKCPTLRVDVDRPLTERYDQVPDEVFSRGRLLLAAVSAEVPEFARSLEPKIWERTAGRFRDEVAALAKVGEVDPVDLALANVSYDLTLAMIGCSTAALPTPAGPVVARNMDWWPEDLLATASYHWEFCRGDEPLFSIAGWPGAVGAVTGLSRRGFAVVLNAVNCPEGANPAGYPVMLHLRRVLEDASDFRAALAMLRDEPLAAAALITLVGRDNNERVVIERTPTRHALRWGEPGRPLLATNDYRQLFPPRESNENEIYRTTCTRYDALLRLFDGTSSLASTEDAALLYALSEPSVIQSITAQHVLMRPSLGELRLFVPRRFLAA